MAGFGTRPAHAREACSAVVASPLGRFVPTARMVVIYTESSWTWTSGCCVGRKGMAPTPDSTLLLLLLLQ